MQTKTSGIVFEKQATRLFTQVSAKCESVIKNSCNEESDAAFLNDSFKASHQVCRHTTTIVLMCAYSVISHKMCGLRGLCSSPRQPVPCSRQQMREPLRTCGLIVKSWIAARCLSACAPYQRVVVVVGG